MNLDIEFIPEPLDEWELACQKVANLTDDPEWSWLVAEIREKKLTWEKIFDRVAAHL